MPNYMRTQIEVEVRVKEPGTNWIDIHPFRYKVDLAHADEQAARYCQTLARKKKREVRWNHVGSFQGHYISAKGKESP